MHPAAPALPESGHPYQLLSVVLSSRQVLYLHLLHQPTEIFYTLLQCSGMRCILLLYHCSRKGNHNNLNDLHHNSAVYLSLFLLHTDRLQPDRSAIYSPEIVVHIIGICYTVQIRISIRCYCTTIFIQFVIHSFFSIDQKVVYICIRVQQVHKFAGC